jgi:streptogramin lyase
MKLRICLAAFVTAVLLFATAAQAVTIVTSGNSDDVYEYTPPGPVALVGHLPFGTNPEGLVYDTLGNLFVAGGGDVSKITPGGTVSHFADLPFSAGGYGMAIDAGNNLYVADSFIGQISKITPTGTVSNYATISGPIDLTFDGSGNLFVVVSGAIKMIPAGGGAASTYATLAGHPNIYGLRFDSAGYLYVSDLTELSLFKITPGGGSFTMFGSLSSGPKGLAFDGDGNLYAAHPNTNSVSKITPDGTTTIYATDINGPRYLIVQPSAVPEPSTLVMLELGMIGWLARGGRLLGRDCANG